MIFCCTGTKRLAKSRLSSRGSRLTGLSLSVTITFFWAPIAAAQSPEAAPVRLAPSDAGLLSPTAFSRMVQLPPANVGPSWAVTDPPRLSLLRQATAAMARKAKTAPVKPAQQKSWVSRHKLLTGLLIGAGVFFVCALGACGLDG